jgi:hypothetical protein
MKFKYRYLRDSSGTGRDYIRLPLLQVRLGAGANRTDVIHTIEFQIHGFSKWIEMEVAFIDAKLPYQLLGQSGFFDNYEINFKRYRGRFEVKSRSFLHRE